MAFVQQATPLPDPAFYGDWKEWARDVARALSVEALVIRAVINGRLTFGDGTDPGNFEYAWLLNQVTNASQNTDTTFTHNIGRVPLGIMLVKQNKSASVYAGVGAWTATTLTLRASATSVTFSGLVIAAPADL